MAGHAARCGDLPWVQVTCLHAEPPAAVLCSCAVLALGAGPGPCSRGSVLRPVPRWGQGLIAPWCARSRWGVCGWLGLARTGLSQSSTSGTPTRQGRYASLRDDLRSAWTAHPRRAGWGCPMRARSGTHARYRFSSERKEACQVSNAQQWLELITAVITLITAIVTLGTAVSTRRRDSERRRRVIARRRRRRVTRR